MAKIPNRETTNWTGVYCEACTFTKKWGAALCKKCTPRWGRWMAAQRTRFHGGRPKKRIPCRFCGVTYGTRELRQHQPGCDEEKKT